MHKRQCRINPVMQVRNRRCAGRILLAARKWKRHRVVCLKFLSSNELHHWHVLQSKAHEHATVKTVAVSIWAYSGRNHGTWVCRNFQHISRSRVRIVFRRQTAASVWGSPIRISRAEENITLKGEQTIRGVSWFGHVQQREAEIDVGVQRTVSKGRVVVCKKW